MIFKEGFSIFSCFYRTWYIERKYSSQYWLLKQLEPAGRWNCNDIIHILNQNRVNFTYLVSTRDVPMPFGSTCFKPTSLRHWLPKHMVLFLWLTPLTIFASLPLSRTQVVFKESSIVIFVHSLLLSFSMLSIDGVSIVINIKIAKYHRKSL